MWLMRAGCPACPGERPLLAIYLLHLAHAGLKTSAPRVAQPSTRGCGADERFALLGQNFAQPKAQQMAAQVRVIEILEFRSGVQVR